MLRAVLKLPRPERCSSLAHLFPLTMMAVIVGSVRLFPVRVLALMNSAKILNHPTTVASVRSSIDVGDML